GGAAVALVEGMCLGSIGTDTGGSIRIPSAACGTAGLKPTFGELPCDGVVPLSTTLDHVGPMARTLGDVRLMFEALKGTDDTPPGPNISGVLRFGVPEGYFLDTLDAGVRSAFERTRAALVAAGHSVTPVTIEGAAWT